MHDLHVIQSQLSYQHILILRNQDDKFQPHNAHRHYATYDARVSSSSSRPRRKVWWKEI